MGVGTGPIKALRPNSIITLSSSRAGSRAGLRHTIELLLSWIA